MNTILREPKVTDISLSGIFWGNYDLNKMETLIENGHKAFENTLKPTPTSGALLSLRILVGKIKNEKPHGFVWHDSDLFKWYEGLCMYYARNPEPKWREVIDEIADMLVQAQSPDGYYNSYFLLNRLDRFGRLEDIRETHELYSMGNIIEASIAHHFATGTNQLMEVAIKMADFLVNTFGEEEGKLRGYDGHQEIEIALIRLYRITKNESYLKLAKFFIVERGTEPLYYNLEWEKRGKTGFWTDKIDEPGRESSIQTHLPLREQFTAEGHAVRAAYMYTAMADIAYETNDEILLEQCRKLWNNIIEKRMYITGGIGSKCENEGFDDDYVLPNHCHSETCAAIGMIYFAQRMFHIERDAKYLDILERILYNNLLGSNSMKGNEVNYINVLERVPSEWKAKSHHSPTRSDWQGCSCCPTNASRFFPSMQIYAYSQDDNNLYVNLYAEGTGIFNLAGKDVKVTQKTDYPWKGIVNITVDPTEESEFAIHLRIPTWCKSSSVSLNDKALDMTTVDKGLLSIQRVWKAGDVITADFVMESLIVRPHPYIDELRGKLAVVRGPIVYCLEQADNGEKLKYLTMDSSAKLEEKFEADFLYGGVIIYAPGQRLNGNSFGKELYKDIEYSYDTVNLRFIPYYMWDNRGNDEMAVWIQQKL